MSSIFKKIGDRIRHRFEKKAVPERVLLIFTALSVVLVLVVALSINPGKFTTQGSEYNKSTPANLIIPAIGVDAPINPVGLNKDRALVVPSSADKIGWFDKSSIPGREDPSIMVGHLDSKAGPGVFYHLYELRPGDKIWITQSGGDKNLFEVKKMEKYPIDNFPARKVYRSEDEPSLRLLTCSGNYLKNQASYTHNLVIYASPVNH